MQEDTQEVNATEEKVAAKEVAKEVVSKEVVHTYYEVDNDLLSKPKALISLLATAGEGLSTVVFCNSPSEADLVEVMLKKEGFVCEKLIGHVPFANVTKAIQQMKDGKLSVVILTDVAARELDVTSINTVVNYSVHEDPEIYLHRITGFEGECALSSVITLVSSIDFANFHYLKKIVEFEMVKGELPDEGVILSLIHI